MGQVSDQLVNEFTDAYGQLRKKLKWHVSDERSLIMVAALYIIKGKKLDIQQFLDVSDYINKNVGVFSSLKSSLRFTIATMLLLRFDNPTEKFHHYMKIYDKLVQKGFKRGNFTYISAISLLTNETKLDDLNVSIERAAEVYEEMKKRHVFLTGQSDYPLAVLLAQADRNVESLMDETDYYYDNLSKNGFRKGNDLQFLSHVLSLQKEVDSEDLMERCSMITDKFKEVGRSVKPMYYPALGVLALLDDGEKEVTNIMNLYDHLNKEKLFRWHKDMNFIMAIHFTVKDKVDHTSLVSTGMQTTMETILQAQQTAMVAAMARTVIIASNNNN
ncbi:hypothetical protein J2S74_000851 [Evansella vedderi]|uniref:DUF4003 domain-containing protein n=1 Tax=Evansella vedderi TaxID=38282 RepID=A0ABT9ZRI2_9BACI|nr:DUF4003 family protein [Evansella vedderi]MDQ0253479.1 hypothetical protein [Evansella vedderi]